MNKNKPKNQKIKNFLNKIRASLKNSDEVIASSKFLLKKLEKDRKKSEEEYEKAQAVVDEEIKKIVQEMDEVMVQFIADTE